MKVISSVRTPFLKRGILRFCCLLAVVFLFQQFCFASLHHGFNGGLRYSSSLHFSQKTPDHEVVRHLTTDIEVEETEEDEDHSFLSSSDYLLIRQYIVATWVCSNRINHQYLHLKWAVYHQTDRPLFELHHSWKAEIC